MELGNQQAGGAKSLAREKLVAAGVDRIGRIVANAAALGRQRRDVSRAVAHGDNAVHARFSSQRFSRAHRILETQRDGAIAPRIVEYMAAVGGENELIAQTLSRFGKDPRLITSGRADQEQALAWHRADRLERD